MSKKFESDRFIEDNRQKFQGRQKFDQNDAEFDADKDLDPNSQSRLRDERAEQDREAGASGDQAGQKPGKDMDRGNRNYRNADSGQDQQYAENTDRDQRGKNPG